VFYATPGLKKGEAAIFEAPDLKIFPPRSEIDPARPHRSPGRRIFPVRIK
jgi:hypothetical protein